MQSFREPEASKRPSLGISLPIAIELTIGLSTLPMLAILTSSRVLSFGLLQLGHASEELFRGEQLPTLPLMKKD
ncbi:MAG: hypothetical protein AAGJ69_06125 [Cyanobacteria bacterium J06559_1]